MQRIGSVNDRRDLPGFHELLQKSQVLLVALRDERNQLLLPPEARYQGRREKGENRYFLAARLSGHYEDPVRAQYAPALGEWMVPGNVEDQVILLPISGEVLAGVIDDPVGAKRPDHVHVPRAAHRSHVRSERLGDLHGERTHASRRTVNQDLLPRPNVSLVTKALKGGDCRHRYCGRLLERQVGRLPDDSNPANGDILGKGPYAHAEDLIAGLKFGHVPANRLDPPRQVPSQNSVLGPGLEQPAQHQAYDVRLASHRVPVTCIDGRRVNAYEHVIVLDGRLRDLSEFEDIR